MDEVRKLLLALEKVNRGPMSCEAAEAINIIQAILQKMAQEIVEAQGLTWYDK